MIYFKTKTIYANQKPDELLSRLTWKLQCSNYILLVHTNSISGDKNRPLIGKMNENELQFEVTRQRSFLLTLIPRVLVTGKLSTDSRQTSIKLRYRLGLFTFAVFLFIFWATFNIIREMFTLTENKELIFDGLIWIAIFPVTGIILVFSEIEKTTNKIIEIFGVEAN